MLLKNTSMGYNNINKDPRTFDITYKFNLQYLYGNQVFQQITSPQCAGEVRN
jgi:hypothetical protein